MNDKLKPCPFCGSEIDFSNAYQDDSGNFIPANIYCPCCGVIMTGGDKKLKYDDKGHLIGGWLTEEELNKYDDELAENWNSRRYVLKPHGRLIDADELIKEQEYTLRDTGVRELQTACRYTVDVLKDAPTVIEAEEYERESDKK